MEDVLKSNVVKRITVVKSKSNVGERSNVNKKDFRLNDKKMKEIIFRYYRRKI